MKTPVQKIMARFEDNKEVVDFCLGLLEEERKGLESAFANGYLKTKSAREYYEDLYNPRQFELFDDRNDEI